MIVFWTVLVLVILYIISTYNSLVKLKNKVDYSIGGIDSILKKRFDLIPNLISSVQEYMQFEKDTLNKIVELRQIGKDQIIKKDSESTSLLKSLLVNVEDYPDLKANQSFIQLQQSLNEVEEQLSAARRTYNANVYKYNNKIEIFPSNILAKIISYQTLPMFEIDDVEKSSLNVKELFKK